MRAPGAEAGARGDDPVAGVQVGGACGAGGENFEAGFVAGDGGGLGGAEGGGEGGEGGVGALDLVDVRGVEGGGEGAEGYEGGVGGGDGVRVQSAGC